MVCQNNIVAQQPVPDDECWYTVLTNSRHVTSSGTVHSQALKGGRVSQSFGKPWSHEISGRLVSLSGDIADIESDALKRVEDARNNFLMLGKAIPSNISFAGTACAKTVEIRNTQTNGVTMDIIYTPILGNGAHADLALYNIANEDVLEIAKVFLLKSLRVVRSANLESLITSCGITAA